MYNSTYFACDLLKRVDFQYDSYSSIAERTAEICMSFNGDYDDKWRRKEVDSQSSYVLALMIKAAAKYCIENNIDANSDKCHEIFFNEVYDCITDLKFSVTEFDIDAQRLKDAEKVSQSFVFRLPISDFDRLEDFLVTHKVHHNSKELERVVAGYLKGNLRSEELDSFMFKILAEEEPIQFIYEMAHKKTIFLPNYRPKLEVAKANIEAISRSTFSVAIVGLFRYFLYSTVLYAFAFFTKNYVFEGANWPIYTAVVLIIIMMFLWLTGLVLFNVSKSRFLVARDANPDWRLLNLVHNMSNFFQMMRSSGKVSLDRIEVRLNELEQSGAVMPETLYVFIDDLKSKGVVSI